jgi:ankyrin repeat protein
VVGLLLNEGADINAWVFVTAFATPLVWAAQRGYVDVVRILLDHGAYVNARTMPQGRTALWYARKRGKTEMLRRIGDYTLQSEGMRGYEETERLLVAHGGKE